ncbi:MAG: bifunctional 3-(3-hydroxy-phenyl)propionate/3-hydroxycinnamic acid hydroxylase MhpA [Ilumatobacteraceae bacterium]
MNARPDVDVVIIGLGPTGLTLATLLGRRGLSAVVLEREPAFYGMARAVYTDDECMRVFQEGGVAAELAKDMNVDGTVQWIRKDGSVLAQFSTTARTLGWPVSNFLYQPYLENTLEDLLSRYPDVIVRRSRAVVGVEQDAEGVTVTHVGSSGTNYGKTDNVVDESDRQQVTAKYVVACDGGRSIVRINLSIDMIGTSFPERWLVVDLEAKEGVDAFRHLPYFNFHCDPEQPIVSCPQPGGHHRFEFMVRDEQTKDEMESLDTVNRLIGRFVDPQEVTVLRKLVYTFNAVVADRWRERRILLAGDAAHMTPQFVGQGMSSGVRDAQDLAWKLEQIVCHGVDDVILDSYERERRPHAKAMIDFSVVMKDFVSISNPAKAKARDLAIRTSLRTPVLGGWVRSAGMKPKPRFKKGQYLGMPRPRVGGMQGTLAPQPEVRLYDGRIVRLDDAIGTGFTLIGLGSDPRCQLTQAQLGTWQSLGTAFVTVYPLAGRPQGQPGDGRSTYDGGLIDVEDLYGDLVRWLRKAGAKSGGLLALRPDKFVFGVGDASEVTAALDAAFMIRPQRVTTSTVGSPSRGRGSTR